MDINSLHHDVMTWTCFQHKWFLWGKSIHWWLVESLHKCPVIWSFDVFLLLAWTSCGTNNWVASYTTYHYSVFAYSFKHHCFIVEAICAAPKQSGAIITWSDITWYFIQHCSGSNRHCYHKEHPISYSNNKWDMGCFLWKSYEKIDQVIPHHTVIQSFSQWA